MLPYQLSYCLYVSVVSVTSFPQLEDFIPEVEEFYKKKHNGRKLYWHHIMSNGQVSPASASKYHCCSSEQYKQ